MFLIFIFLFLCNVQACISAPSEMTTLNVAGFDFKIDDAAKIAIETVKIFDEISRDAQAAFDRKRTALEQEKLVLVKKKEQGMIGDLEYKTRLEGIDARMKQLESDIQRAEKTGDAWNNNIQEALKGGWQLFLAKQQEEALRKTQVATAVASQVVKNEGAMDRLKFYFEPQNMARTGILLSAVSAGIFASYYGFGFGFKYLESVVSTPSLVQETSVISLKEQVKLKLGFTKLPEEHKFTLDDVVLAPEFKQKIKQLAEQTQKTHEWGIPHRHWLLYGPPGTGKTMIARIVARKSGMDYAIIKGSGVLQYSEQVAIQKIHEIFDWAENRSNDLIILFDEADSFLRSRSGLESSKVAIVDAFLSRTNSSSEKYKIIFATNHPEDLDSAVLSRIDEKIEISLPGLDEREAMLNLYIDKYIKKGKFKIKINGTSKEQILLISDDINQEFIKAASVQIDGFSGRDIEKMIAAIRNAAIDSGKSMVTMDIFTKILHDRIAQHNKCTTWESR